MLQMIWVSTSQSYKCLDVTNDLALNFTILQIIWIPPSQDVAASIYMKYVNQKQHMNLNVHKLTLQNFFYELRTTVTNP